MFKVDKHWTDHDIVSYVHYAIGGRPKQVFV